MPDLNLIDESGFEESPAAAAPQPRKRSSGGGGGKTMLFVILLVIVAAVVVYFLNSRGIIKLWGKKAPPVAQVEEQFPQEPTAEELALQEQAAKAQQQVDTNEVALLETPPVEEVEPKEAEAKAGSAKKAKAGEIDEESAALAKLSEMKGEFTVQVVAYREKKKAEEMSHRLEFSGYPSFVERVPMKGGDWYTVRIGRYPSREEAKKAVKTFAMQLQSNCFIDKVRAK
jgi:septal ring-binding cell division protein DamX